jgi:N-acetyl-S-(2-succino)cysteine monooxygenase
MTLKKDTILFWMPEWGGFHPMAWREEGTPRDSEMDFKVMRRMVQTAERGKLHGCFIADGLAVGFGPSPVTTATLSRTAKGTRWEPLTLLSAMAACTKHIGVLGTVSTTFSEPYNIARMFASLDYLSGGRAGWNVVTSGHPKAPLNFGIEQLMGHDERYERSQEFFDIVAGLWDSWEDDAFVRDKASGLYFHPEKLHALNYRGKHLSAAGPLNIARPVQGHPVIAQAGSSKPGRAFAARIADVIYTMHAERKQCKEFYDEVKEQVAENGRKPEHCKVLQAMILLVGRSQAHAEEKLARLDALVDPIVGMESLTGLIKADLSGYPLDGPVPEIPEDQSGSKTGQKYFLDMARRDNLTIRQLMQVTSRNGLVAGTPITIADTIQEWMEAGAADGFCFTFGDESESLEIFVDEVVPELQRRGLFQTEYRGTTLRENLGLPRPPNRFATPLK